MKTPTLGYEDDTEISKSDLARVQLEEAIAMFVAETFLCALTLAGAAEVVLAGLVNASGHPSTMEQSAANVLELKKVTGLIGLADVTEGQLFKGGNKARNAVKHHSPGESDLVILNLFDEAYWMILRALKNASLIGVPVRNQVDFKKWVIVNINM